MIGECELRHYSECNVDTTTNILRTVFAEFVSLILGKLFRSKNIEFLLDPSSLAALGVAHGEINETSCRQLILSTTGEN